MIKNLIPNLLFITLGLTLFFVFMGCETRKSIFSTDNLVAWCIVPFDAKERGPVERARMLKQLGITPLAYDWRKEHDPTADEEWKAVNEPSIGLQDLWMVAGQDPANANNVQAVF